MDPRVDLVAPRSVQWQMNNLERAETSDRFAEIQKCLTGIPVADRKALHPAMSSFVFMAARNNYAAGRLPTADEVRGLAIASKSASPESNPAMWLEMITGAGKQGPGRRASDYSVDAQLQVFSAQRSSARLCHEVALEAQFPKCKYDKGMPEFAAALVDSREEAEKLTGAYSTASSLANTAVIQLGGKHDGSYLAIGYIHEDITTSHVFQALKLVGIEVDSQAEAQVSAFDQNQEDLMPLGEVSKCLAGKLPYVGTGTRAEDLTQLHAQPHRYDMEALGGLDI